MTVAGTIAGGPTRRQAIVAAARTILEGQGAEALTMRRLGEALGIRAPSLYKHFPDKDAIEMALIEIGLREFGAALAGALGGEGEPLAALGAAYRACALAHPHLYRLMNDRPLPRDRLPPEVEADAAAPLMQVTGSDVARSRALWAFAHGLVMLEMHGRFPPGADVEAAWQAGIAAFVTTQPSEANIHACPASMEGVRP